MKVLSFRILAFFCTVSSHFLSNFYVNDSSRFHIALFDSLEIRTLKNEHIDSNHGLKIFKHLKKL